MKGCEYLLQLNDDSRLEVFGIDFVGQFIGALQRQGNIGVVGPTDAAHLGRKILTHTFVHKQHLDIFGRYFPEAFKNWFSDDWITQVYAEYAIEVLGIKVGHLGEGISGRYKVDGGGQRDLLVEVEVGKEKVRSYLRKLNGLARNAELIKHPRFYKEERKILPNIWVFTMVEQIQQDTRDNKIVKDWMNKHPTSVGVTLFGGKSQQENMIQFQKQHPSRVLVDFHDSITLSEVLDATREMSGEIIVLSLAPSFLHSNLSSGVGWTQRFISRYLILAATDESPGSPAVFIFPKRILENQKQQDNCLFSINFKEKIAGILITLASQQGAEVIDGTQLVSPGVKEIDGVPWQLFFDAQYDSLMVTARKKTIALDWTKRNIEKLKDTLSTQRCVVMDNGPSIGRMDTTFLQTENVFATNYQISDFKKYNFTPTFYIAQDYKGLADVKRILEMDVPFRFVSADHFPLHIGLYYLDRAQTSKLGFSLVGNPTISAMHLAYFTACRTMVLIGLDHAIDGPIDRQKLELDYKLIKQKFETNGRQVFDATVDGQLPVFQKKDYQTIFVTPKNVN